MSAELIIRPGHVEPSWDDFVLSYPPYSVALDGYVRASTHNLPAWEDNGPKVNFDHHAGVDRSATLATSQQVLRALRRGFVTMYSHRGEYCPTVYANDCDQDVALSWYLLMHGPDIAAQKTLKRGSPIRRLVDVAGDLDATAGAYPYPAGMKTVREVSWIFRPYTEARTAGLPRDAEGQRQIIGECCGRIGLHLAGRGKEVKLDTRFKVLGGGKEWAMFEEEGAEGRIGAFRAGINAFVVCKGQRPDGTYDYSIGRTSEFINFDVGYLVLLLNEAEGIAASSVDRWGCDKSGLIGGSPRFGGSRLAPSTVIRIINKAQKLRSR